jgi:hypothetical protein
MSIRIEFADEPISIFLGKCRELCDEGFDRLSAGFPQGLCATEIGGVSFHEAGIEVVLAYQQAKLIAQAGLSAA